MNKRTGRSWVRRAVLVVVLNGLNASAQKSDAPQIKLQVPPGTACTTTMHFPVLENLAAHPKEYSFKFPPSETSRVVAIAPRNARRVSTFADGSVQYDCFRGEFYLGLNSITGTMVAKMGTEDAAAVEDFRLAHFPELAWVNQADYRGLRRKGGKNYLYFEAKGASAAESRRLWVDPKTKYPAYYQSYQEDFRYSYGPSPATDEKGRFPLPPLLAKDWERITADAARYFGEVLEK